MNSSDQLQSILKAAMSQFDTRGDQNHCGGKSNSSDGTKKTNLAPSQILVIGGLLGGVLEVQSVLVDKSQIVQIVLAGSLKQKTQLEKIMDQMGTMPFDEVMKAIVGRL